MTDDLDFTSYVSARWAQLVRCLIAMGVPAGLAQDATADTFSRIHDDWDERDEWADIDVHVIRDLFDRWDGRRDAWWDVPRPDAEAEDLAAAGWSDVEAELDRLEVADRRGLVLERVVGLSPDQVREVIGGAVRRPDFAVVPDLLPALELIPVDPPPIEAMIAASARRKQGRRRTSVLAAMALVLAAGVVALLVVTHEEPVPKEEPEQFATVPSADYPNPSPLAFYGTGVMYLPESRVEVRDVREFAQWGDGAVYLDVRGNLITVSRGGERARIATVGLEATFAVFDEADQVVWVDPAIPELVLYDLANDERLLERELSEQSSGIAFVQEGSAYLNHGDDFVRVDLEDGVISPATDPRLPGELDRHEPYVLTREGGGAGHAKIRLYDLRTKRPVPLDVGDSLAVSAARFAPDGSVMLLIEPPDVRNSEVRRCAPPYDDCRLTAYFAAGGARSLLPL